MGVCLMIEVRVARIVVYNKDLIVLLKSTVDEKVLPISIDPAQAQSIELKLEGLEFPRPLTHDLMMNMVTTLGWKVERAEISDLVEHTFYARLMLSRDEKTVGIDSRPSDAIALALRCSCPIVVEESVMDKAGVVIQTEKSTKKSGGTRIERLESKLSQAVEDERYEDAARIRDEIKVTQHSKTSN